MSDLEGPGPQSYAPTPDPRESELRSEPPVTAQVQPENAVTKLFGALLMAIGALIATLCGLCSLAFGGSMIAASLGSIHNSSDAGAAMVGVLTLLAVVIGIGGIPVTIGVLLFFAGRRMSRGK